MKLRAFLAFEISDEVKKNLSKLIADFSAREKAINWVDPEHMHVTLKFFGSVEEDLLLGAVSEKIATAISGVRACKLHCRGIGVFPDWRYPKVIWAGFTGDNSIIIDLQQAISDQLKEFNFEEDKRRFRLHLTIGRVKGKVGKTVIALAENLGPVEFGKVTVDKLILFKSQLTKKGPIYTKLKVFVLTGTFHNSP